MAPTSCRTLYHFLSVFSPLVSCVQDHYLFAQLGEPDLSHMMEAMQRVNKGAGEGIIKQGDKGAEFYILEKGTADVSSHHIYNEKPSLCAKGICC